MLEHPVPPRRPRWLVPALGATAAAVMVAAVLVVATDDGGDDGDLRLGGATTTTTTGPGADDPRAAPDAASGPATTGGAPPPGGGGTDGDTGAGATTTTAPAAGGDDDIGAPQDPGPISPPRAGGYRYRTVTDDGSGPEEEETVTMVAEEQRTGDEVVQVIDGRFGGIDASNRVRWRPGDVHLLETTFEMNGRESRCDWEPDHLEGTFPMQQGTTWSASSSCEISGFGATPVTVTRESTSTVTRLERRRIADQVLDLWVVESTERIEFASVVIDATSTRWFSPPHGLTVRAEGSTTSSGQRGSGSYESELLNLEPE